MTVVVTAVANVLEFVALPFDVLIDALADVLAVTIISVGVDVLADVTVNIFDWTQTDPQSFCRNHVAP